MIAALALLLAQAGTPEALSERALEFAQQRRFAEAERLWREALTLSPHLYSAAFNLGFLLHSQGDHAQAETYLQRAVRAQPGEFNARYLLGSSLSQLGRTDDALRQWRVALALQPSHGRLLQVMAVEYGKGQYFREAAGAAERALRLKADDPAVHLIALKAHHDAADHDTALRIAEGMVRRFPTLPRANFEYGFALLQLGRRAEGMPFVRKAMDGDPTHEEPLFFYGEALLQEGRAETALAPLRRAVELKPDYVAARMALARALLRLGQPEAAEAELHRAATAAPTHPQPHLLLAQLYLRRGDEPAAVREKETALRLRREYPEATESRQGRPFPDAPGVKLTH